MGTQKEIRKNPKGRKTGKIDPKSTGNSQNGALEGPKKALGPFSAFQGPGKTGIPLKGLPNGSRRVGKASRRVCKAFEGI